ncbi:winged helix-turn-helix domain-containing protein [Vibrio gigantis]|uniref:winged helix-turn-helix domain-containing protein n=1 Tax=Vibrio gigantis TaxID=296199 RepID=UPI001EFC0652|nr:winged helix-turn-helix domain-containing protein [Vibrio gigantis]ULN65279.1 winged helix-turn-helix domain-containing protein [Vibrio gigantis]
MKQQSYQICDARYDPLLRQFVREDGHVETIAPIEGKVFLFLLENTGECIERGLIFDRCWGDVIVSEQALTNVISKIRKTLSRVTCGCATIRTVSKTGYLLEINESIKPSKTGVVSSPLATGGFESNSSSASQEVFSVTETSTDVNTTTAIDSDSKTSSNQEQNTVVPDPSNSKNNAQLVKAGYLVALICVLVTAFNLFQTYYAPLPYFIDKAEYRDSYTDNTNHYFFHIAHNESYSLPAITQKLTAVIPSHCNVNVFVRIYPSVDLPENDALYMLVQKKSGEALNYSASIFNIVSSFDSFAQYMEKRSYFCD